MAGVRLLVLCSVVAAVSCQFPVGRANPRFCLELLRNQDKERTTRAMLTCIKSVRSSVEKVGRQFRLPQHYSTVGRCIAQNVGLVNSGGGVNKDELRQRILRSSSISEQQRNFYLDLVPTCDTWDGCLTKHCMI